MVNLFGSGNCPFRNLTTDQAGVAVEPAFSASVAAILGRETVADEPDQLTVSRVHPFAGTRPPRFMTLRRLFLSKSKITPAQIIVQR